MDREKEYKEWFYIAGEDLESAVFLQNKIPTPLEITCFLCQQSAEKYLKGYLVYHSTVFEKNHNLIVLNKKCMKIEKDFKQITNECVSLNPYSVEVRYPYHMDLTEYDMKQAITHAQKIKDFILTKVGEIG